MKQISKIQFLDVLGECRKLGCAVSIDLLTGAGRLCSPMELVEIAQSAIEIHLFEAAYFSTYEIFYKERLDNKKVKVVLKE